MSRDRVRKISLLSLLILALAAFAWFGLIQRQPRHDAATHQAASRKDVYYCPMHKNYHSDKPGTCPICSMKLVKLEEAGTVEPPPTAAAPAAPPPASPSQDSAIFVPPEKQQLIGMRSVVAEV